MQVQNLVTVIRAIQAIPTPPSATQPLLAVWPMASQLMVKPTLALAVATLYYHPTVEAAPPPLSNPGPSQGSKEDHSLLSSQKPRTKEGMFSKPPVRIWLHPRPTIFPVIGGSYHSKSRNWTKIQGMDQRIKAIHNLFSMPNNEFNSYPPFDIKIMQTPLPRHLKIPQL